jgi:hypothetical protein
MIAGPSLMLAVAIHQGFLQKAGEADSSFFGIDTTIAALIGEAVVLLIGFAMFWLGVWRLVQGQP